MRSVLKILLLCIVIGLAFGSYFYFTFDQRPARILMNVLSSCCIGSLMMLAIYQRHYFTTGVGYQSVKVIIMIGLLITAALVGSEITFMLQALLLREKYTPFSGGSIYILNILVVLVIGIPIYISEEWKSMANSRILSQQYRVLQLEQQQTAFELELLRAKINPHFLYNMHNTIAGLIFQHPQKAEELVMLLSKFFRFTLNKNSTTFHSVADELDIITTYLHMQQIRYGDRLSYNIQADQQVLHAAIPSFILQPVVENAIKHGIENSSSRGFIEVKITPDEKHIVIMVADSGTAFPDKPGTGVGLQMIMNKLKLLYADNFEITLNNIPEKYVRIVIPRRDHHPAGG
jgi:sensor histidine kinase YesM